MEISTHEEFEEMTGLEAKTSMPDLRERGARLFTSEPFEKGGEEMVIQQMQYGDSRRKNAYLWKRIVPLRDSRSEGVPFEIHHAQINGNAFWYEVSRVNEGHV